MTKREFKQILAAYIAEEQNNIMHHDAIKSILLKVDGKLMNGRTLNKRLFEGTPYSYQPQYGMYYIVSPVGNHLIGYERSSDYVNAAQFEEYDACCGNAAKQRVENMQSCDVDKAYKAFKQVYKHFEGLRKAFGDLERLGFSSHKFHAYHDVMKFIFDHENEGHNYSKIRLTDFYYLRK